MFIDHIHQMFVPFGAPNWLDWFGRPVATIFFFVSVIGFSHTHNKKKYMSRLYLSMVLMTLFTFALEKLVGYDQVVLMNNIFRDLFIGTLMMFAIDLFVEGKHATNLKKMLGGTILFILPILFSFLLPLLMESPMIIQNQMDDDFCNHSDFALQRSKRKRNEVFLLYFLPCTYCYFVSLICILIHTLKQKRGPQKSSFFSVINRS